MRKTLGTKYDNSMIAVIWWQVFLLYIRYFPSKDLSNLVEYTHKQIDKLVSTGMVHVTKEIDQTILYNNKINLNPNLEIQGIVLTMYDKRNKLCADVEKEGRNFFGNKVYNTNIPRNVRISEAPSFGMPVILYDKYCTGTLAYNQFVDEFLSRENLEEKKVA